MYTKVEMLHSNKREVLYRGVRDIDGQPVILKVLPPHYLPERLAQLKHEYSVHRLLQTEAVEKLIALDTCEGRPALVTEDFGGEPLACLPGMPIAPGRFLPLGKSALVDAARKSIVQKRGCFIVGKFEQYKTYIPHVRRSKRH